MKNCPFCTASGDMLDLVALPDSMGRANIRKGMIRCKNCGAQGPETWAEFTEIESTAVFAWDDRQHRIRAAFLMIAIAGFMLIMGGSFLISSRVLRD